jgi:hypothetical protein
LSHSASPVFLGLVFLRSSLMNYLPLLALNQDSPDLCLLSN